MRSAIYNLLLALSLFSLAARAAEEMSMEELTNLEPVKTTAAAQHREQHPSRSDQREEPKYGDWAGIDWPASSTQDGTAPSEILDLR